MGFCLVCVKVLGAASSVIDFVATHPYPVFGWDYMDYVNGTYPTLQVSQIPTHSEHA
jgi:hypothetical protein